MKKLLAVMLAAVLALGSATVALADNTVVDASLDYDFYAYDEEWDCMGDEPVGYTPVQGGITLYIPVTTKVDTDDGLKTKNTGSIGHMKNYRLRPDYTEAAGLISDVQWKVATDMDNKSAMFVAVKIGVNNTNKDVEATLRLTLSPKDDGGAMVEGFDDSTEYEYTIYVAPGKNAAAARADANTTQSPATGSGAGTTAPSTSASEVTSLITEAKKNGNTAPVAGITVKNENGISAATLKELATAAKNAGGKVRIVADTTMNGVFGGRLTLAVPGPDSVTTDIFYGVSVSGDAVNATKALFEKYYNNTVSVVRLEQNAAFGFPVSVAAKPDLTGLDSKNLKFYAYDRSSGSYFEITKPGYSFDSNGFLHFTTSRGGDIIITDKTLVVR